MISILKIALSLIVLGYLVAISFLFIFQRQFLYAPTVSYEHDFLVESINSGEDRIDVVVLNPGQDKALLYFPGNAESVVLSAPFIRQTLSEYSIYMMNYPGYATSTGQPSEKSIYAAAEALYDFVGLKHGSVSVLGRSLGSGVATYIASTRKVEKLALITPFDSIVEIAKKRFPFFPVSLLLKDRYNSFSRVDKIEAQTLILIAEMDQVIPFSNTEALINLFPKSQLQVFLLKGVGHNGLSDKPEYASVLGLFFI